MITLGIDARSYDSPGRLGRYCRNVLAGMLEHGEGFRYVVWLPDALRPELLPNAPEWARLEVRACAVATGDAAGERSAFLEEVNGTPLDVFCSLHSPVPAGVAAPSLLVIHDLCALKFPELHRGEAVDYWQSTLPGSLERVTAIIADSSQTAADVELYFPRHAHRTWVIPPGVESRFFESPDPGALSATLAALGLKTRGYVLHLGKIESRESLRRALEAYEGSRLAAEIPLVMADAAGFGGGELRAQVERVPENLPVRFLDHVAEEHLPHLLQGALVSIFPSLYEGSALSLLEAMASGVAVLASNAGSLPELAGDGALLVDPHDVKAIREGMERLAGDDALRAALSSRGCRRARHYTWQRTVQRILWLSEHLASGALTIEALAPVLFHATG
jgi:alpha-1,3-rhamnosyl/mannosyltransferase